MIRGLAAFLLLLWLAACGNAPPAASFVDERHEALLEPGQELYWRAEYDSARVVWGLAVADARMAGDSLGVAKLLTWMGLAAWRARDHEGARALGEEALELKLALGDEGELARSYNALGMLALDENRLLDGIRLFDRAKAAATASGDDAMAGAAAGNLGLIQASLGDLDQAAMSMESMLEAGRAAGNPRLEANALTNLAMVAVWAGEPQAALAPLDSARRLYRDLEYHHGEQYAMGQLVSALAAMGEYQQALATVDSALVLSRLHRLQDQEADNLRLLGGLFADLGDTRRALQHLGEAADLARELGMDAELGSIMRRIARLQATLGADAEALEGVHAALAAHRRAGEVLEEVDGLTVLAGLQGEAGDIAGAASTLRSARALAEQVGARSALTAVGLAEIRHHEAAGDPRAVLRGVARTRSVALPADFAAQMEMSSLAARAYDRLGLPDSAVVHGMSALEALERVRSDLASAELRSAVAGSAAALYSQVVLGLLRLDRTSDALVIADAGRSRELLQQLTSARSGRGGPAASGAEASFGTGGVTGQAEAELLLRRIDALLDQLRSIEMMPVEQRGTAESTADEILARVSRLRDDYESLQIRAAVADPRAVRMLGAVRLDETGLRNALDADEALLHYTVMEDRVVVFIVRRHGIRTVQVQVPGADVASRVRLLRELWGAPSTSVARGLPAARGLYQLLIAPVVAEGLLQGAGRLVIVPHGILEQLPFAALQDPNTGRFLVEDYDLSHAASANALIGLRHAGAPRHEVARRVAAFAPLTSALPGTRLEAVEAGRAGARASAPLTDGRATEQAVRRALASEAVVHIASHGVVNNRNPMFSRMELARGRSQSSSDDGRLEVHEVLRLQVNSSLVVLSGCETGVGEYWTGDPLRPAGVSTLATAFLQAGARNVMATLWRVDDVGSAELVRVFYGNGGIDDPVRALSQAQRTMIHHADYSAPYFWAGYAVLGEGGAPAAASIAGR